MTQKVSIRRASIAFVAVALMSSPAAAQTTDSKEGWFDAYRTFSVYLENDALAKHAQETTDRSFTQGLRLTWEFSRWPRWAQLAQTSLTFQGTAFDACRPDRGREGACGTVVFGLGQTIYSPDDIITSELQPRDQPYAGWLFGSVGIAARHGTVQSVTEVMLGVVGPSSIARDTQSLAHWTWATGAPRPAGWDHQLRNSLHVGAMQTYGWHVWERCTAPHGCDGTSGEGRWFDVTVRSEVVMSTLMRRGSLGATARLGKDFPDAMAVRIPMTGGSAGERKKWFVAFVSVDGRGVNRNGFIEGTYADDGPTGWRAVREIQRRPWINEISGGFGGGTNAFGVMVQFVNRSLEWDPVGAANDRSRHSYVSLSLSLNRVQ